jgi:hypothetical protein
MKRPSVSDVNDRDTYHDRRRGRDRGGGVADYHKLERETGYPVQGPRILPLHPRDIYNLVDQY